MMIPWPKLLSFSIVNQIMCDYLVETLNTVVIGWRIRNSIQTYNTNCMPQGKWGNANYCRYKARYYTGIILWMRPANERRCYIVTSSFIVWAHTQNDPWLHIMQKRQRKPLSRLYTYKRRAMTRRNKGGGGRYEVFNVVWIKADLFSECRGLFYWHRLA